jgi:Protein of unknown function (DUF3489)
MFCANRASLAHAATRRAYLEMLMKTDSATKSSIKQGANSRTIAKTAAVEAPARVAKTAPAKVKRAIKSASKPLAPPAVAARAPSSKIQQVIDALRLPKGATIAELSKLTGWQHHSVRGAISGTLKKRMGLAIERSADEDRGSIYRIVTAKV